MTVLAGRESSMTVLAGRERNSKGNCLTTRKMQNIFFIMLIINLFIVLTNFHSCFCFLKLKMKQTFDSFLAFHQSSE